MPELENLTSAADETRSISTDVLKRHQTIFKPSLTVQKFLTRVTEVERRTINQIRGALTITEHSSNISLSILGLEALGFKIKTEEGILTCSKPGHNEYKFSNTIEASSAQLKQKGYRSKKPVYLEQLNDFIDPYRLVDFYEWLALQELFLTRELPVKAFFQTDADLLELLYLIDKSVFVFIGLATVGKTGSLLTWGAGPCIGLAILDTWSHIGLLTHLTATNDLAESIEKIVEMMAKYEGALVGSKFVMTGGVDEQDGVDFIKQALTERGAILAKEFTGRRVDDLRLNIDGEEVEVRLAKNDKRRIPLTN